MSKQERKSKKGFVVDNGVIIKTVGYSCAPQNPDMWWCPSVGFSTAGFYIKKSDAVKVARKDCQRSISLWQDRLEKLYD